MLPQKIYKKGKHFNWFLSFTYFHCIFYIFLKSLLVKNLILLLLFTGLLLFGFLNDVRGQEILITETPDTLVKALPEVNLTPLSEIDIPVSIALKAVYLWANKFVDTMYTSPDYPKGWVEDGCSVRYQYQFKRGPFSFRATNNVLVAKYTGYYGVRGSTRVCSPIGNSPWTPPCSCGFGSEKPRRIDAGFATAFKLNPNYTLGVNVRLTEPAALDKCSICFFGKDITTTVAGQLKTEMQASMSEMQMQLQTFSMRPYLQTIWDTLQVPYAMPGFGYLGMQPEAIRISQAVLRNDSMFFSIGLSARPELKADAAFNKKPLPAITDFSRRGGFSLYLAQTLPYDSLNAVANEQAAGKEFSAGKGLLKKTVRIDSLKLLGGGDKIFIKVYLSKAIKGMVYLEGKLFWDAEKQFLEITDLKYEIKTRQVLVRSAAYLLDGTIEKKLKEYTRFDVAARVNDLSLQLNEQMNREIAPGIKATGLISMLKVDKLIAQPGGIYVAGTAQGNLNVNIDAATLIAQYFK